jgi:DNA-binding beta-propeller fold protein YncE
MGPVLAWATMQVAKPLVASLIAVVASAGVASPAGAADSIFWGSNTANKISRANLDGSGFGSDLSTLGATVGNPTGTAIDPAANKIYWVNAGSNTISVANLDGSGGAHNLDTTGATVNTPVGIAIDPAANKIYWGNVGKDEISVANLDGSGGGHDLEITGATVVNPQGLAIDPAANKLYWANAAGGDKISEANLDGSEGHDLSTTGATVDQPVGVAIDPAANKIYWANAGGNKISEANLDGSGEGHDLDTGGASALNGPSGVAIDPTANRIYWTDKFGDAVSEANLDGSGDGHDLSTTGATVGAPDFPALLKSPAAVGPPVISGGSTFGSALSCSEGSWAGNLYGALLYRAPRSFDYSWSQDGTTIPGAVGSSFTPTSAGSYSCRVTAQNAAGSASQTSAAHVVGAPAPTVNCVVPKLRGKKLKGAKKALRRAHCRLGKVRPEGRKSGKVKKQRPKAGKTLPIGSKVNVKLG